MHRGILGQYSDLLHTYTCKYHRIVFNTLFSHIYKMLMKHTKNLILIYNNCSRVHRYLEFYKKLYVCNNNIYSQETQIATNFCWIAVKRVLQSYKHMSQQIFVQQNQVSQQVSKLALILELIDLMNYGPIIKLKVVNTLIFLYFYLKASCETFLHAHNSHLK